MIIIFKIIIKQYFIIKIKIKHNFVIKLINPKNIQQGGHKVI